jgi:hypothetical protein
MVGLFLRVREHHRDRLPVPVDEIVLHDRQIIAACRFAAG